MPKQFRLVIIDDKGNKVCGAWKNQATTTINDLQDGQVVIDDFKKWYLEYRG